MSTLRSVKHFLAITVVLISVSSHAATTSLNPTEYEQYMLELINRARANPTGSTGEVARLDAETAAQPGLFGGFFGFNSYDNWQTGPSGLNEGPPNLSGNTYNIPPASKQPLAFDVSLLCSTDHYVTLMNANQPIDGVGIMHNYSGLSPLDGTTLIDSSVNQRIIDAGFTGQSFPTADGLTVGASTFYPGAENNSTVSFSQPWISSPGGYSGDIQAEAVDLMHHNLFVDNGIGSRGHRITMMASEWQVVGIGMHWSGLNSVPTGQFARVFANHNFGYDPSMLSILTGVAFNDNDSDSFYTPDGTEALGGLTVEVVDPTTGNVVASTTTFSSGGYSIPGLANGTYSVRFLNSVGHVYNAATVSVTGDNVKVDAISPVFAVPEPSAFLFVGLVASLTAFARRRKWLEYRLAAIEN